MPLTAIIALQRKTKGREIINLCFIIDQFLEKEFAFIERKLET
jgi:hypothetical protein